MDTVSSLGTLLGAVGTLLSAIVALVQLFTQMRQGHTSRPGFWIITVVFVISAPLTAFGGYSLYKKYKRLDQGSKIALFAPDFAQAELNDLGENSVRSVYIREVPITIPASLPWYTATLSTLIPRSADYTAQLKETHPLDINYPAKRGFLYYWSTIDRNRPSWSAVRLALITPINLATRSKLIIVLHANVEDTLELKLRDFHGSVDEVHMPIKRGWAAYVLELTDGFSDINLSQVQMLQFAHPRHLSPHDSTEYMFPLIVTR